MEAATFGREVRAQPGGHITHGRVIIQVLFGDFSQREERQFFFELLGFERGFIFTSASQVVKIWATDVSAANMLKCWAKWQKCGVLYFFECREGKDKRGERSAGETWLQAAAEWTSNDMTHAYLHLLDIFCLILISRSFHKRQGCIFLALTDLFPFLFFF